jgi:RNA polymerase sigma-70 factor (ECF subfamily)
MSEKSRSGVEELTLRQFVNDDMRAFDKIYYEYNPRLQKFVHSLLKSETDTEEIVQEVFVRVWENRQKIKSFGSFESYLFSIAYNTTINLLRKRVKEARTIEYIKSIQIEIDNSALDENPDWHEIDGKINLLIEKMPARQKEVFKMRHFQGLSYKEIAGTLDLSVNTIENHLVKAHRFLKESLGNGYLSVLMFIFLFR